MQCLICFCKLKAIQFSFKFTAGGYTDSITPYRSKEYTRCEQSLAHFGVQRE